MSNREEFEKAYTNAFIGEDYAQDKMATAYAMWQARVPEGYVVVPVDPTEDMIMAGCMEHGGYDVIDSKSIYKAMIEAGEK